MTKIENNFLEVLRTANEIREKEWDPDGGITLEFRGNELAGEVGEACNIIKKIARKRLGLRGSRAKRSELANELADIIMCTDLIAMDEGIDLCNAVMRKFNKISDKHNLSVSMQTMSKQGGTDTSDRHAFVRSDPKKLKKWINKNKDNVKKNNNI